MNNVNIPCVNEHKHLGIHFDSNLKWSLHIDNVINSVSKMVSVMQKLKFMLSKETLLSIYTSFVRSKLEYGCVVWDDCTDNDKLRLEKIQIRCAQIITGAKKGTRHELLYKESSLSTLSSRRKEFKLKMMYKIVKFNEPKYLYDCLPKKIENSYSLRDSAKIRFVRARTEKFRKSFIPDCIRLV